MDVEKAIATFAWSRAYPNSENTGDAGAQVAKTATPILRINDFEMSQQMTSNRSIDPAIAATQHDLIQAVLTRSVRDGSLSAMGWERKDAADHEPGRASSSPRLFSPRPRAPCR